MAYSNTFGKHKKAILYPAWNGALSWLGKCPDANFQRPSLPSFGDCMGPNYSTSSL